MLAIGVLALPNFAHSETSFTGRWALPFLAVLLAGQASNKKTEPCPPACCGLVAVCFRHSARRSKAASAGLWLRLTSSGGLVMGA